jgi:hypothetical protein
MVILGITRVLNSERIKTSVSKAKKIRNMLRVYVRPWVKMSDKVMKNEKRL